ncbi:MULTISPECIES: LysR family transcriptional regulator [unclassified Leptolyngbya]|uniref:LysR family transcriptional regulator n=1 Tax=unclassified Leptolyngbya TaxID=2650499 RepID=UPI001684A2C2|nr:MULTISPECIES: LysR family transcriptional regulator [unclassified Leptolyngbya]MBD1909109.1 LysR family transcriptional regulator [Leptolyngbya sp. FACHB-8]MBD2157482.1 LysR family transcriptional regulator [Leptolyngbya sp. FACHB-16]
MGLDGFSQEYGLETIHKDIDSPNDLPAQSLLQWISTTEATNLLGSPRSPRSLKQLTLHQLRVFEAAARYRSFTRAAKELDLTQPTISMQIKQLADLVGMPLFEQVGKQVFLTGVGQEMLTASYKMFEKIAEFEMRIADLKGLSQGHLKIATISPINTFVSRLLSPFCQRYPGIEISVDLMNSEQIFNQLAENTHDLYLMCEPPEEPGIYSQSFVDNPLVVVAPPYHRLATQAHIPISQMEGEQFVMREIGSATRRAVKALLDQHGVSVRVQLEVGNNEAIKQMVMYGLGISVLSYHMVMNEVANGQLVLLNVEGFPINRNWYAVYPLSKQLSVVASTFLQYLKSEVKSFPVLAA